MSIMESLRRLSSRGSDEKSPSSPAVASPRTNTWQDVFNPGRNYNMKGQYFDKAENKDHTVWTEHLASKSARPAAPDSTSRARGMISEAQAREMFSPDRIDRALKGMGDDVSISKLVRNLQQGSQ